MSGAPPPAAAYFGGRVALYDSRYDAASPDGHALRARMAAVLRRAGDGPGEALDAGMGAGRLLAALQAAGWTVSGIDASAEMVALSCARLLDAAGRLHCAAVESLPFGDASFDLVTATGVLEYADLPTALAELRRVVRPDGRVVVTYPNPQALYGLCKTRAWYRCVRGAKRLLGRPRSWMPRGGVEIHPDAFVERLREAGLDVVQVDRTSCLCVPSPLDAALPRLSAAAAARLERGLPRGERRLATQVVYTCRRREPAPPP